LNTFSWLFPSDCNTVPSSELSRVTVEKCVDCRLTVVVGSCRSGVKVFGDECGRSISCRDDQLRLVDSPFIFAAITKLALCSPVDEKNAYCAIATKIMDHAIKSDFRIVNSCDNYSWKVGSRR